VVFAVTSKNDEFTEDIWNYDSGSYGYYCNYSKGLYNDEEEIKESITFGKAKIMMATRVGSLKCRAIQFDGSGLDITVHDVKFVSELW
jgi:hypothetical protein